jgi:hypothetical protein
MVNVRVKSKKWMAMILMIMTLVEAPLLEAAPRSSSPVRTPILVHDSEDYEGVYGDEEKEQVNKGELKPEHAELIPDTETGRFNVKTNQPIYEYSNVKSKVVGRAYPGESFSVVTVGRDFFRVRFNDGRAGFIVRSEIWGEKNKPAKMETECKTCTGDSSPKAIDEQVAGLGDIAREIDRKTEKPDAKRPPRTRKPDIVDDIQAISKGRQEKLIQAANHQARVCRTPASYLRKRKGSRPICGNRSKGMCYRAVKQALMKSGIVKYYIPGGSAKDAHYGGHLKKAGMKNIMSTLKKQHGGNLKTLAKAAPAGAVLVYEGGSHGHGHIEIKTTKNQYCSDYCKSKPINEYAARKLIAVYMP